MKTTLHKAGSRGVADYGWLKSYHTFSFANYYDPERVHFGALRVLNDDYVVGGQGFGEHPHDNMEIITIPLKGALAHKDSMGNAGIISVGEIQVMSAGTGIKHSEFNHDPAHAVEFLQIWVLPNTQNVAPRYDQKKFDIDSKPNDFITMIAPYESHEHLSIKQDAYFHVGHFSNDTILPLPIQDASHGVYIFMIEGELSVDDIILQKRDGLGLEQINSELKLNIKRDSKILLIEVPML